MSKTLLLFVGGAAAGYFFAGKLAPMFPFKYAAQLGQAI